MKKSLPVFLHYEADNYPEPKFSLFACDMSTCGYLLIGKQDVEVEIPDDFDPIAAQVAQLKQEREKVRSELSKRLMEIDDSIAKLTCIEYTTEAA